MSSVFQLLGADSSTNSSLERDVNAVLGLEITFVQV